MTPPKRFSDVELEKIVNEGAIYMCACPAQVAVQLRHLRALIDYQSNCQQDPKNDMPVHQTIAKAAISAHVLMEDCMEQVLILEGWDRQTLTMPDGLRQRRDQELLRDI